MIHAASAGASGVESDVRDSHAQSQLPLPVETPSGNRQADVVARRKHLSELGSRAHWPVQFNRPTRNFFEGEPRGVFLCLVLDLASSLPSR
jgi:hypothetical protein